MWDTSIVLSAVGTLFYPILPRRAAVLLAEQPVEIADILKAAFQRDGKHRHRRSMQKLRRPGQPDAVQMLMKALSDLPEKEPAEIFSVHVAFAGEVLQRQGLHIPQPYRPDQ